MLTPSIYCEPLFDDFFDDFDEFFRMPAVFDRDMNKAQKKLYGRHSANMMKTDVQEHEDHYEVDVDLPGFKKEDMSVQLKDGYLTISASKNLNKDKEDQKTGKYIRQERYSGTMSRSFYVGEAITQEDIKAKYESGVLRLTIPKKEPVEQVDKNNYIAIEG